MDSSTANRSKLRQQSFQSPQTPSSHTPHSLQKPDDADGGEGSDEETFYDARFPPEEETSLVATSNATKTEANTLFSSGRYSEAISTYDKAIASCPNYLDYEVAVLRSNIAACHVRLGEWKEAIEAATASLAGLDRLDPLPKAKDGRDNKGSGEENGRPTSQRQGDDTTVVELAENEDDHTALEKLALSDARRADISRIRAKALMRRARARSSLSGWANLAGAEEDYKLLASDARLSSILPPSDMTIVRAGLRDLPPQVNQAKEKEMAEMMGKLKELGNGILRPFGLSTDNFKMTKDDKSGGYSMTFEQNPNKK